MINEHDEIEQKINNLKFGFRASITISCCYAAVATVNFYQPIFGSVLFTLCAFSQGLTALKIIRGEDS
tara:strand:+ start:1484 stop:1687 length:204 start_codon:yes stop_codon:yes gene_type:complete